MDMDQLPPRPQFRCFFTLLSLCLDQVERFKLDDFHFAFYFFCPVYLSQKSTEEEQLLRVGSRRKERNSGQGDSHSWISPMGSKRTFLPFHTVYGVLQAGESPLHCKEIKPVNPKGNQPRVFIGRTDAEVLIVWPPDAKSWLTGRDPDAGKDWRQEKGTTEDEMIGWHHRLNGHELE